MQNLFNALSEKYDGAEVKDVKFIVNPNEANGQNVDMLDELLAHVVRSAIPLEGPTALV
jgi:hypothetical protein